MRFANLTALVALLLVIGAAMTTPAQTTIITHEDTDMPYFPTVAGRNINGVTYTLPQAFTGDFNVVLMAFTQRQQYNVNTWLPPMHTLQDDYPMLGVYEVPALPQFNWFQQMQTDFWMSQGISDPVARETTITLYTDLSVMGEALGFTNGNEMLVFLLDGDGQVL
ncbi:MAG: hypothetical protein AAF125_20650, partial [Chloroflexota bacterium]